MLCCIPSFQAPCVFVPVPPVSGMFAGDWYVPCLPVKINMKSSRHTQSDYQDLLDRYNKVTGSCLWCWRICALINGGLIL